MNQKFLPLLIQLRDNAKKDSSSSGSDSDSSSSSSSDDDEEDTKETKKKDDKKSSSSDSSSSDWFLFFKDFKLYFQLILNSKLISSQTFVFSFLLVFDNLSLLYKFIKSKLKNEWVGSQRS